MDKVAILTTTFYKNLQELRFRLACELVECAYQAGHDVVIVDGSPDPAIEHGLADHGAIVFRQQEPGIGPSRRQLFQAAMNPGIYPSLIAPGFLFWTEPEKVDLIRRFVSKTIEPLASDKAEIAIPWRTPESWETYPTFQRETEQRANAVYAEVTGQPFDPMFGPVAWVNRPEIAELFASCNPQLFFGAPSDTYIQHVPPIVAMHKGHRVASVPVDFIYPPEQKAEEEAALSEEVKQKRLWQLEQCAETYRAVGQHLGMGGRKKA